MASLLNQILNISPYLQLQFISKISRAYLTFFSMLLKSMSCPLTEPNRTSNGGIDLPLQSPELHSCIQFEIRKDSPVDLDKL